MTIIGPDIGLIFSLLTAKCIDLLLREGPLENFWRGGGGGEMYKKNFRARENEFKKIHARQLTLKNIHAKA